MKKQVLKWTLSILLFILFFASIAVILIAGVGVLAFLQMYIENNYNVILSSLGSIVAVIGLFWVGIVTVKEFKKELDKKF